MQLKSIFAPFFDGSQSNLIGIETVFDREIIDRIALNRTLLELKLLKNSMTATFGATLSIEPYWN